MKENQGPLYVAKYNLILAYTKLSKSVAKRKLKKIRKAANVCIGLQSLTSLFLVPHDKM